MISAVERIYLEVRQPSSSKPAPKPEAAPPIELDRSDVNAILAHKRDATPDELQFIVNRAKELQLTSWQRNQIGVQLTIALVNRSRPKPDTNAEFISNTLQIVETPVGPLHDRAWVQRELRAGARAIASCRAHRVPRCSCWREARERLWKIQDHFGSGSPETWATERIWEALEEMERASRPERASELYLPSQPVQ
jgi:hypothetical protein